VSLAATALQNSQQQASAQRANGPITATNNLVKQYGTGSTTVNALAGVDVEINRGELTVIMGPSGSGKSTLMHCLAGLDTPTSGSVEVAGTEIAGLNQRQLTKLRRTEIGFVFQAFNLIPTLTAAENITLPLELAGESIDSKWFDKVVAAVGLEDRLQHRPGELSGGQQQRVACARALLARPAVVFADEPTGNLDSQAATDVLQFLRDCVEEFAQSIVMVTHDPLAASYAHRVIFLADGQIAGELLYPTVETVLATLVQISEGAGDGEGTGNSEGSGESRGTGESKRAGNIRETDASERAAGASA